MSTDTRLSSLPPSRCERCVAAAYTTSKISNFTRHNKPADVVHVQPRGQSRPSLLSVISPAQQQQQQQAAHLFRYEYEQSIKLSPSENSHWVCRPRPIAPPKKRNVEKKKKAKGGGRTAEGRKPCFFWMLDGRKEPLFGRHFRKPKSPAGSRWGRSPQASPTRGSRPSGLSHRLG